MQLTVPRMKSVTLSAFIKEKNLKNQVSYSHIRKKEKGDKMKYKVRGRKKKYEN